MSKKIIVVGNGIFTRLQGVEIDKFDMIVRLSSAKVRDYEPLVGSRTDVVSVARIEDVCDKNAIIWMGNPCGVSETPEEALRSAYPNGAVFNEAYIMALKYFGFPDYIIPTLGLLTIFMAVQFGKYFYDTPVTITGFDLGHPGTSQYYYDPTISPLYSSAESKRVHHNSNIERKALKKMVSENLIQFLFPPDIILMEDDLGGNYNPIYKGIKL